MRCAVRAIRPTRFADGGLEVRPAQFWRLEVRPAQFFGSSPSPSAFAHRAEASTAHSRREVIKAGIASVAGARRGMGPNSKRISRSRGMGMGAAAAAWATYPHPSMLRSGMRRRRGGWRPGGGQRAGSEQGVNRPGTQRFGVWRSLRIAWGASIPQQHRPAPARPGTGVGRVRLAAPAPDDPHSLPLPPPLSPPAVHAGDPAAQVRRGEAQ
jgi:hypothetical protein